jgi:hypothetical protein
MAEYALSIKQPWAALLVHGLKTIEVRRWPTARRGLVHIHAARVPDDRPEGWALLPKDLKETADLRQGLIGVAQLLGCRSYRDPQCFAVDQKLHLNEPSWFEEPGLYGFLFADAKILPFQRCPGWVRFFEVQVTVAAPPEPPAKKPRLVKPP